jgi:hypothetical protein
MKPSAKSLCEQGEQSVGASPSEQSDAYELSDCSTIASSKSSVADTADVQSDEENEVAHTQAELELDHRLTFWDASICL